jgi:hypothetical protein
MFSFFTRNQKQMTPYNSQISKYIFDVTNKIKINNETKIKDNKLVSLNVDTTNNNTVLASNLIPVISMLSFLAGYYLANK